MGSPQTNLGKFDHIVVLMLENHSLDSLAGYLYGPGSSPEKPTLVIGPGGPDYNGVAGKTLSNSIQIGGKTMTFPVKPAPFEPKDMSNPFPDPGEVYSPHINTQVYGQDPPPKHLPDPAPMSGFVKDYCQVVRASMGYDGGRQPTPDQLQVIMNSYPNTDDSLPVLSGLARSFAVSDEWFCSVPSQTFCNRSFFNSGSSHGYVSNGGGRFSYAKWIANDQKTIFNGLLGQKKDWRIYFDKQDALSLFKVRVSLTGLIHFKPLAPHLDKFVSYEGSTSGPWPASNAFLKDCQEGCLPEYSFIEPRLFVNHNDMHPPFAPLPRFLHEGSTVESSILAGEWLVNNVYDAVMSGPKWDRTLLVITLDEHGGCYDHVSPPTTVKERTALISPGSGCGSP